MKKSKIDWSDPEAVRNYKKEKRREWCKNHPNWWKTKEHIECVKKWTRNNPQKRKSIGLKWRIKNPEKVKNRKLRYKYGITIDQYNYLVKLQDGKCTICGSKPKVLYVDHDHSNNKNRGLLCNQCNAGLGCFRDSQELLEKAKVYLLQANNGQTVFSKL